LSYNKAQQFLKFGPNCPLDDTKITDPGLILRPDNEIRRIGLIFKDNIYSKVSLIRANWDSVNLCPIINPNNSLIVSGNVERHLAHLFSNFYYLFFAQFIWKKAGIDLKFFRIIEIKIHVLQKTRESESARIKIFWMYPDFRDFTVYYLI